MGVNRMSHDSKETTDRAIWSLRAMAGRLQGSLLMGGLHPSFGTAEGWGEQKEQRGFVVRS